MLFLDIDFREILDANWIATILGIFFSLFIFLLSVPILFFQTFLPEDIREIYNKYDASKGGLSKFRYFKTLLIWGVCVLANHGIKFLLDKLIPDSYAYKSGVFLLYYLASIAFFIFFTLMTYKYFISLVLRKKDIRKEVVDNVVAEAIKNYEATGMLQQEYIDDLLELGKAFTPGINKSIFLFGIKNIVKFVLENKKHIYDGDKLNKLVSNALNESLFLNSSHYHERNLLQGLHICNLIQSKTAAADKFFDINATTKFIYKISIVSIEQNYSAVFQKGIGLLNSMPDTDDELYDLNKIAFQKAEYSIVTVEISKLIMKIDRNPESARGLEIKNLIAYLSWFFSNSNSPEMVEFARVRLRKLRDLAILNHDLIDEQMKEFKLNADFFTSDCMRQLLVSFPRFKQTLLF